MREVANALYRRLRGHGAIVEPRPVRSEIARLEPSARHDGVWSPICLAIDPSLPVEERAFVLAWAFGIRRAVRAVDPDDHGAQCLRIQGAVPPRPRVLAVRREAWMHAAAVLREFDGFDAQESFDAYAAVNLAALGRLLGRPSQSSFANAHEVRYALAEVLKHGAGSFWWEVLELCAEADGAHVRLTVRNNRRLQMSARVGVEAATWQSLELVIERLDNALAQYKTHDWVSG